MIPFQSLHALAAARGDGLRPELLAHLDDMATRSQVVELARYRGDHHRQSGPRPAPSSAGSVTNVVAFVPRAPRTQREAATRNLENHEEAKCISP